MKYFNWLNKAIKNDILSNSKEPLIISFLDRFYFQ